jgi:hypothetical protein
VPKFVTKISHDAHPELYGDNQAAFSVALDQYGVTVIEQALAGNMAPVGVVYSLQFLGLRPAYTVHLNIDWDRVQKHMDEHFGVNTLFTSIDIDNAVDKLVESRAIVLEADTFVPEGEDTASIISSRDRALNEVRDMITDAFFTSSIDPVKPRAGDWDKAMEVAGRIGGLIATGGWGGVGMFSYTKQNYTRVDKKVLDVNMSERTTVERSIYPQGHLTGLFQVLRDQHLTLSDFVTEVNLNDPWFQRRRLKVISRANYDADQVGSVSVNATYGAEPHNVVLDKTTSSQDIQWLSRVTNGAMELPVTVQFSVSFQGVDGTQRPLRLESPPSVVTVENVEIEPRTLYSIVPIPIAVPNPATFPWARYPTIEVHAEYEDAARHIHNQTIVFLKSDAAETSWPLFVQDTGPVSFRYKLIYRGADNKDVETDWKTTDAREVMVRDPFPDRARSGVRRRVVRGHGERRPRRGVVQLQRGGPAEQDVLGRPAQSRRAPGLVQRHVRRQERRRLRDPAVLHPRQPHHRPQRHARPPHRRHPRVEDRVRRQEDQARADRSALRGRGRGAAVRGAGDAGGAE